MKHAPMRIMIDNLPDTDEPIRGAKEAHADEARAWVVRLASGEMGESDMAGFKAWLAEDPAHRGAFDEARALWQRAEAVETMFTPQPKVMPWHRRSGPRIAMAGGLVAAALVLAVTFDDLKTAALADYSTPPGGQRTVALADGSTVYLNTDSALSVSFSASERRVELLHGEAYFDVAPDGARPFHVRARRGTTQAVGTAFAVREDGPHVTVSVADGTVSVTSPEDAGVPTTATVMARAGERVVYRQGEAPVGLGRGAPADAAPWRRGRIVIDGLPFAAAIAELDRYRPGRIVLLSDPARYRPVSGVFATDRLDEAIEGLAATQGLTMTRLTDYLLVLR